MRVNTTIEDRIAHVCLERPPANAMEPEFLEEIAACFSMLEANGDVGAVVLRGTGKVFSAGVDLKQLPYLDIAGQDRLILTLNKAFAAVYGLTKPVIGALNGHAIAGGMVLALCCDYRIAPDHGARFGLTEVRVGVAFPEVAYAVIEEQLPRHTLRRMIQFGQNIDGETAFGLGAVDELVPSDRVIERATDKARACLEIPPGGYREVKRQLRGVAIEKIQALVEANNDKYLGRWIDDDARAAALRMLKG